MKFAHRHLIKALILDMDGVIWRGSEPIGDLPAIFARMDQRGLKVTLATNNATRSAQQYVNKLLSFGVHIEPHQVINSADIAALYLSRQYPQGGKVFVVGEEGLLTALAVYGFSPISDSFDSKDVIAVVASMDRNLTYEKLRNAALLIRAGVPFVGTNPDHTFPTPDGLVPGAGAILAALETATSIQPVIMGKPKPEMYQAILSRFGLLPQETLVVGDRPETDIAGGQVMGCFTALVLSGVTNESEARAWHPAPDLIAPDLYSLLDLL